MAELGAWFAGAYRISRAVGEVADDAGAPPEGGPKGKPNSS